MSKLPHIHINEQVKTNNQQKIFVSSKAESEEPVVKEYNVNDYLLTKKITYAADHKSKNVIIKFKDSNITTDVLGKSDTHLKTKNGDIAIDSIVNIYL